jgi:hypothetical protein
MENKINVTNNTINKPIPRPSLNLSFILPPPVADCQELILLSSTAAA